ncbi:TIGR02285 family protein [Pseudomonas sp. 21LCFQ02]|uniref:TIGR02285 family protein n=1 Tax=Pseudomonas sp. 21LCFQ02 TaxID=2957505 RepID=UPI00209BB9EA|nr:MULTISPECIES: TIGR02285 family protein [unclassified Pseudomonas]MCO8171341.1 TIGR02285 family protein [Pseudomonas sp. 21LCFQ02]MCQ9427181.1 TIGR02285 family protein [Pseudomonas sp. LJDD11]
MCLGAAPFARLRLAVCLLLLGLGTLPGTSQAKDTLIWLMRDMPPVTIFSGPDQGQGAIDKLMPLLIARMPQYDHLLMRVNRARGLQMLNEPSFTCDPTLLWTAERAKKIIYSIPTYAVFANGLTVRKDDLARFTPFIANRQIDLKALLASKTAKIGVVAGRSYGPVIDQILSQVPEEELSSHYGNDAIGSMLQMQRLSRIQAMISYWPEARYQALQQGIRETELVFLPVKDAPKYQFTHIGCSDTEQGREAMAIINREMRVLREEKLIELYAEWLDPKRREEYLQDAKTFFIDK